MTAEQFGRTTQARFILDAHLHGLNVATPFDSMPGYDYLVDTGRKIWRVQVKGATLGSQRRYSINVNRYGKRQPNFDIVAVWMSRENRWAFLPRSVRSRRIVRITPFGKWSGAGWDIFR